MKKILIGILGVLIVVGGIAPEALGIGTSGPTISGYVKDLAGNGIPGVTMSGLPESPTTAANGYYSATVPHNNWSGTVKPQKIGYAIFPFLKEYVTVSSDQTQDYTAVLLPKVALSMQPTTYNLGDPINITMTLENQGSDFFTLQGFMATNFALLLQFIDPDLKLITSNFGIGRTPSPPAVVPITTAEDKVELLQVEYVENVPANWVLSMPFNVLDYYTLTKGGNYSVKAKFNVRAYLPDSVSQTDPKYGQHDSGSSGDVESNIVSFAIISSSTLDHITINPTSSTIIAGGSQTYATRAFDVYNSSIDVTAQTLFTITNGSCSGNTCTALAAGLHSVLATYIGKTATASLQVNAGGLDHITISPASATIIAGGNQSYTAQGFGANNNSLGDVTAATTFSITPNGSCTGNTCTATVGGAHTVTGNDSGKTATASLQVNYNHAGFFSPTDNPPTVNKANAGQAITVKWRLTDANGVGISDTGSFISLTSYQVSCTDWASNPGPAIKESAAGASGVQYLGSGNWQYNWKTSKGYAGTCRVMVLTLKDGTQHTAEFKFK
jgi:hypothetical protein